jgi:hypothetical protein
MANRNFLLNMSWSKWLPWITFHTPKYRKWWGPSTSSYYNCTVSSLWKKCSSAWWLQFSKAKGFTGHIKHQAPPTSGVQYMLAGCTHASMVCYKDWTSKIGDHFLCAPSWVMTTLHILGCTCITSSGSIPSKFCEPIPSSLGCSSVMMGKKKYSICMLLIEFQIATSVHT